MVHRPGGNRKRLLTRRAFVAQSGSIALLLAPLPGVLKHLGLSEQALASTPDVVSETFNGLVAFVVPGSDPYSVLQGESSARPGGIDAGATPALIAGLNFAQWFNPTAAEAVATLLNGVALSVNPGAGSGSFASPFANPGLPCLIETKSDAPPPCHCGLIVSTGVIHPASKGPYG